jgi:hypothetical protein
MNKVVVAGQVRHVITIVGTVLVTTGALPNVSQEDVGTFANATEIVVGGVAVVGAAVWSWIAKVKK